MHYLGLPLLPGDISLIENISGLLSFLDMKLIIIIIPLSIGLFIAISYIISKISKFIYKDKGKQSVSVRIVAALIPITFLYFLCINNWFINTYIRSLKLDLVQYTVNHYISDGYILSFAVNIRNSFLAAPKNYDRLDTKNKLLSYTVEEKNNVKPNVIVILSEAFIDPTIFEGVEYSEDPIPTFHLLCQDYTNGKMLSPTFGGYTNKVEFEVLTGFSNKYLPESSIPYLHYIKNRTDSLVSVFKNNGYKAVGLHPFNKQFYNRFKVYPLFGFDKFISDTEVNKNNMKGGYISDDEFANQIISEYNNKGNKKLFLFGLTMQNHLSYFRSKYHKYDINISSNSLSEEELGALLSYAQGVHDSDKALKKLVDYFSKVDEETVILFYGDHFPSFGENSTIYDNLNFSKETIDRYTTPFLIWSNYDTSREDIEWTSSNFLGNDLLNYIGIRKNSFFEFLDEVEKEIKAMRIDLMIGADGNVLNDTSDKIKNLENLYEQFQYYLLFDKYKD
jgi:phosphoglycerol transferase MdoB-like AlkP superfamily enzyme